MMIACISDVHGNLPALEAAVADAQARGAERIFCAGDMTGYGPFPDDVCTFLRKRRIPSIIGNYDRKVIDVWQKGVSAAAGMKPSKRAILLWTVKHLDRPSLNYLAHLPDHLDIRLPAGTRLFISHGTPLSADDTVYPSITARALKTKLGGNRPDILVCGHTHIPFVRRISSILVVNCSSTGHPIDGDPRPAYALLSAERDRAPRGRIIRFDYDRDRTIATLRDTSLPKGLQKDFAEGNKRRFLQ